MTPQVELIARAVDVINHGAHHRLRSQILVTEKAEDTAISMPYSLIGCLRKSGEAMIFVLE